MTTFEGTTEYLALCLSLSINYNIIINNIDIYNYNKFINYIIYAMSARLAHDHLCRHHRVPRPRGPAAYIYIYIYIYIILELLAPEVLRQKGCGKVRYKMIYNLTC